MVGNLTANSAKFGESVGFPPKKWRQLKRWERKKQSTFFALIKNAKELEDLTVNYDLFKSNSNLGESLETLFALDAIKDSDDIFLLSQIPEFQQLAAIVAVGGFMIVAVVVVGVRAALRKRNTDNEHAPLLGEAHSSTYSSTA